MISFIIPLYNKSQYIGQAIQSVLDSDIEKKVEIIVVDDCSTDNSTDIVRLFSDERVLLVELEKNGGPSNARNVGVSLSKYPFIFFLDGDDFVHQDLVSVLIDSLKLNFNLNYICVGINFSIGNDSRRAINRREDLTQLSINAYHRFLIKNKFVFTASSTLINKRVFDDLGGFDSSSNFTEDAEFWARLSNSYEGYYVNQTCSYYRLVEGSLSDQFVKGISEVPILLLTLDKQCDNKKNGSDEFNAFCYMTLKYYFMAISTNSSACKDINDFYVKRKFRFSYLMRLKFILLKCVPSVVLFNFVVFKRFFRKLLLSVR